jgi:hypothetical protein
MTLSVLWFHRLYNNNNNNTGQHMSWFAWDSSDLGLFFTIIMDSVLVWVMNYMFTLITEPIIYRTVERSTLVL